MTLLNLRSVQARMLILRTGLSGLPYSDALEILVGYMVEGNLEDKFIEHDSEDYAQADNLLNDELTKFFDSNSIVFVQGYFAQPDVWRGLLPQFRAAVSSRVQDWSQRYSVTLTIPSMENNNA